ncbi:MAG: serine protease [Symploca sp. SIO2D2]|nr:serine protease [Symploca sp. SIO2D2]
MTLILGLFVAGVILVVFEVFVPGGVLGVLGSLCILAGVVVAYDEYGLMGGATSLGVAAILTVIALYVELKILPKTSLGRRLFLTRAIEGDSQAKKEEGSDSIVGKIAQSVTPLAPTGVVSLDGKKMEASSRSGFVDKNVDVKIVGKETFRIIVSKL